jgi:hypothetical protein
MRRLVGAVAVALAVSAAAPAAPGDVDLRLSAQRTESQPLAFRRVHVLFVVRFVGSGEDWRGGLRYTLTVSLPLALKAVGLPRACLRRELTITCSGAMPRADVVGRFALVLRPGPPGRYLIRARLRSIGRGDANPADNLVELPLPVRPASN